jgi:NAD(P)-dependent dehydrogenase (short-subunit alcohol dehydrogenase family)
LDNSLGVPAPQRATGQAPRWPDNLAGAIAFFASDDASYITGQVVSVSGGLTMNG